MVKRFVLFFMSFISLTFSQERFNGAHALGYVEELCQPKYKGRRTGSAEARRAALWISDCLRDWGTVPLGDHGGYLQLFPMLVTEQRTRAKLKLHDGPFGSIDYLDGVDFMPYSNSGSGKVSAEVVFVGFGISAAEMGWDDYAGVDVRGKIVLIYRGTPAIDKDWAFTYERSYKVSTAAKKGAKGILMLDRGDWPIRGATVTAEGYQPNLPVFNISKKTGRDLFVGLHKNIDHLIRDLAKKPQSMALNRRMEMAVQFRIPQLQEGENVLALLRGSDPVLADEVIVVGAHMDHNGLSLAGHLYAGADDNASGTAVVMELARALQGKPLKRSVLLACFGGEEQGLLGSHHFAYHPTVTAEKIAAMINLDMEGAGDGGVSISGRNYYLEPLRSWFNAYSDSVRTKTKLRRGSGMFGSDHAHFVEQGIPAFYFSSTGDHPFYHQFEDDPSTLNVQALQFVGDRCLDLVCALANAEGSLLYNGDRSGRFFYLFGDQIDFSYQPFATLAQSDSLRDRAVPAAVRCVVYGLSALESKTDTDLYARYDRLEQQIKKSTALLRFKNAATLDEAAAQQRVCAAVALDGALALQLDPAHSRTLCRAGVNWLTIRSAQAPFFDNGGLSSTGRSLLQTWSEENGMIECCLADTGKLSAILTVAKAKTFLRLRPAEAAVISDYLAQRLEKGRSLLLLESMPQDSIQTIWRLYERLKPGTLHLSLTKSVSVSDQEKYHWLQKLYDDRKKSADASKAYSAMIKLLAENINNFIGR